MLVGYPLFVSIGPLVPVFAVGTLAQLTNIAALHVNALPNWLKMLRVYARPIPAQMVDYHAIRNWTHVDLV